MNLDLNSEQLKSYLLGNISNDLAEKIDFEIISNKDFEEDLIIAEESLIEDFIEEELTPEEIELFNKNFLTNEERKSQFLIISQLKKYAKGDLKDSDGSNNVDSEPNFFQKLKYIFAKPVFNPLIAVLILCVAFGLIWIIYSNNTSGLSALETEYAVLNKNGHQNEFDNKDYSKLVLINGNTRSIGNTNKLSSANLSEKVLFNLAIRTEFEGNETFTVKLYKDDELVFTQPNIPKIKNAYGAELKLLMPAEILTTGQYQVKVKSNDDINNKATYNFVVK